ncbi:hypothetical protein [Curtobacterium sp. RRHDQ10]|uniref:hypothetical protein n=1 Tax=Curtobacterium phyllosphaerae TaxID=3413379 RepID=UPI003BEFDE66
MNKSIWFKKALALPACAAIVVGGIAFSAVPANADPADLKVTSQSVSGRVLTITGQGTPGENIQLDEDFRNTRHEISPDGSWTITYTIPGTDYNSNTYTIEQLNGLNQDGSTTVTAAAEQPAPTFAITSHTVSGRTLTVSGTGTPGNTVQIDPQSAPIARTTIPADGNWTFTYEIPASAGTDTKTYSVLEENNGFQVQDQASFTAAAEATQAEFSVTSPKNGDTVGSRTVTFTGTGQEGDQINLLDTDGNRLGGFGNTARVGADQTWSLSVTFPADAAQQQAVRVTDVRGGSGAGDTTITINLPAADTAPTSALTLVTPTDGSTVPSRTVTYSGKGTPGDAIAVVNADGEPVAPATLVEADGTWTTTGTFSDSAALQQDLTVGEVDPTTLDVVDAIDFTITLPAVVTGTTPGGTAPRPIAPVGTLPVVAG